MRLPRWTVYPALVVIGAFLVIALPERSAESPYAGAAVESAAEAESGELEAPAGARTFDHPRVVVLGIDGMDPDILAEVIEENPERMTNFRRLIASGDGIQVLGTSCPPQSPVAWSNFITGMDAGGHGVFDFIHRDLETRAPASSIMKVTQGSYIGVPGRWQIPIGGSSEANRTGASFWGILRENGVPADIWRMPANFPVEPSLGLSFPGMMAPAIDSAYGECSYYTSDSLQHAGLSYKKAEFVTERNGVIHSAITGPVHPLRVNEEGEDLIVRAPFTAYVDREANAVAICIEEGKTVVLGPGEWSDFVTLTFDTAPWGTMTQSGIARFYLRSIEPEFELYCSPVNLDPHSPVAPVSEPEDASAELADAIGPYYTQGMAEDVNALKKKVLTDEEFMQQANLVFLERNRMLDYALDRYTEDDAGGLLFFYYSSVDLICHMMWRHADSAHPHHDAEFAAQDSTWWSEREGSTWKDVVKDLYMKFDPIVGEIMDRLGDDITFIVMSDHGFASFRRKFNLNTWLLDEGYLVLKEGRERELERDDPAYHKVNIFDGCVDWSKTRAYGMGFNGLYLNLARREADFGPTEENEAGIVQPGAEADALLAEIKRKLEAIVDDATGLRPIVRCDLGKEVYHGPRQGEGPDIVVGYNAGYGNSDEASLGRVLHNVIDDNLGGTFNGHHLMAPEVVHGIMISNRPVREGFHSLHDVTVEVLGQYGIDKPKAMRGHRVLE